MKPVKTIVPRKQPELPIPTSKGWNTFDSIGYYIGEKTVPCSSKVAGFNLDHTLFRPRNGKSFPDPSKYVRDWELCYKSIKNKFESLIARGFKIVIFTNQVGIPKNVNESQFKERVDSFLSFIKASGVTLMYSKFNRGKFHKPNDGMFTFYQTYLNGGTLVDKDMSFYVGNVDCRSKGSRSSEDAKFATKVGVRFFSSMEYFQDGVNVDELLQISTKSYLADLKTFTQLLRKNSTEVKQKNILYTPAEKAKLPFSKDLVSMFDMKRCLGDAWLSDVVVNILFHFFSSASYFCFNSFFYFFCLIYSI